MIKSSARSLRHILKHPGFTLKRKISYVKAHIFSAGLFQCSTWPSLAEFLYKRIHHAILYVYRVCTNNVFNPTTCAQVFNDKDLIFMNTTWSPPLL